MFYLYLTAPGMPAQKFLLDRPITTIGRSSMNDLPIGDKMLSRQHARILRDGERGLTIEDLGSRNGTFVKEHFFARNTLASGSTWELAFSKDPEQKYIYLTDGQNERVRIVDGVFANCLGLFEGISDQARVAVLLELLGRKVRVKIDDLSVTAA